jgi:IS1 family transposase
MNRLGGKQRIQIVRALVEGNSLRSTARITGFAKNTVTKLMVDLGRVCAEHQDKSLRSLPATRIECGAIWSFCHAKARIVPEEQAGESGRVDIWTWTALDLDSKLMCSWLVGDRGLESASQFADDLAPRLANRVQITTRGENPYMTLIERAVGMDGDGTLVNTHVERQNLTVGMGIWRYGRLTNGFSRKVEDLAAAVAVHFLCYNFARAHQTLGRGVTPAMAAGIADHMWSVEEVTRLLDSD